MKITLIMFVQIPTTNQLYILNRKRTLWQWYSKILLL